jgi:ribosomal protein S18 acetylase RimI-like enzyme
MDTISMYSVFSARNSLVAAVLARPGSGMPTIRVATTDDLPQVVNLWDRFGGPTRNLPRIDDAMRLLERDPEALVVAVEDGRVVGTLIVGWDGWRCHLYRLAVGGEHRRQGIAQALVAAARARAEALGAVCLDAMVRLDNAPALALWEGAGFELTVHDVRYSVLIPRGGRRDLRRDA